MNGTFNMIEFEKGPSYLEILAAEIAFVTSMHLLQHASMVSGCARDCIRDGSRRPEMIVIGLSSVGTVAGTTADNFQMEQSTYISSCCIF